MNQLKTPYHRTIRPFVSSGLYEPTDYIQFLGYSESPKYYIRAFQLIQKDLIELFDFIEPATGNLKCYSFRIHQLLARVCIEVESNFRGILEENSYPPKKKGYWNMADYKKLNKTHKLSFYKVKVPNFHGKESVRRPFKAWIKGSALPWYEAYNSVKHDRVNEFKSANLKNLLDAVCGLLVVLSS
jgi:hypothetical protein